MENIKSLMALFTAKIKLCQNIVDVNYVIENAYKEFTEQTGCEFDYKIHEEVDESLELLEIISNERTQQISKGEADALEPKLEAMKALTEQIGVLRRAYFTECADSLKDIINEEKYILERHLEQLVYDLLSSGCFILKREYPDLNALYQELGELLECNLPDTSRRIIIEQAHEVLEKANVNEETQLLFKMSILRLYYGDNE